MVWLPQDSKKRQMQVIAKERERFFMLYRFLEWAGNTIFRHKYNSIGRKEKGQESLLHRLFHNFIFLDTLNQCKSGFLKGDLSGRAYEADGEGFSFESVCLPDHSAVRLADGRSLTHCQLTSWSGRIRRPLVFSGSLRIGVLQVGYNQRVMDKRPADPACCQQISCWINSSE